MGFKDSVQAGANLAGKSLPAGGIVTSAGIGATAGTNESGVQGNAEQFGTAVAGTYAGSFAGRTYGYTAGSVVGRYVGGLLGVEAGPAGVVVGAIAGTVVGYYAGEATAYAVGKTVTGFEYLGSAIKSYAGFCFAAGTQITLANGETRCIEEIVVGDSVLEPV